MIARNLDDRWLRPEIVRFVAGVSLAIAGLLAILMFATNNQGRTAFGTSLGNDYAEFYVAGQILNDGPSRNLYDLDDQDDRLHRVLPKLSKDDHLPFVYPPFLALIFRPLARLPLAWSVATWLAITVGFYALSVALILRQCRGIVGPERTTAWLLALAFPPFAMECCLGGQISAIGCVVISAGLVLGKLGRPFASGLVLSILCYKPTLLILILPMVVISRAWRVLGGFIVGGAILGAVSWLVVGLPGCRDFLGLMVGYGKSGGSVGQGFKTIKYVDFTAFLSLLGVKRGVARPLAGLLSLPVAIALVIVWARTKRGRIGESTWASTLVLTPILNIYGPIYDVSVIVPGLLIGANSVRLENPDGWPRRFRGLLAFLFISALVTQPLAQRLGFQPLSLGLLALGSFFLARSLRDRSTVRQDSSAEPDSGGPCP
jgi:hypothetical protein